MSRSTDLKRFVAEGYDRVADEYLRQRAVDEPEPTYLDRMAEAMPEHAAKKPAK